MRTYEWEVAIDERDAALRERDEADKAKAAHHALTGE